MAEPWKSRGGEGTAVTTVAPPRNKLTKKSDAKLVTGLRASVSTSSVGRCSSLKSEKGERPFGEYKRQENIKAAWAHAPSGGIIWAAFLYVRFYSFFGAGVCPLAG